MSKAADRPAVRAGGRASPQIAVLNSVNSPKMAGEMTPALRTGAKNAFLTLIVLQALHSIEEYTFRLYEVFSPARFASGLVSNDRRLGFVILNIAIVAFGAWCYLWPVRREWRVARPLAWLWITVESINGIVHPAWSMIQRAYTPGVITALGLLPLALRLAVQLRRSARDIP
jgi:Protein of unknown function with HXXEE motif